MFSQLHFSNHATTYAHTYKRVRAARLYSLLATNTRQIPNNCSRLNALQTRRIFAVAVVMLMERKEDTERKQSILLFSVYIFDSDSRLGSR